MSKEQDKVIKRVMLSTSEELGSVRCMKDIYNVAFQENGETDIRFLVEIEKHYQSKGLSFPRLWNECLQQFGEPKIKNIEPKEEKQPTEPLHVEKPQNEQKKVSISERVPFVNNNFIKLSRKMLGWEWYTDVNTKTLFIHCLLKANWKKGSFKGVVVNRGEFITSLQNLANETGLSVKQIRVALKHLETTEEIKVKNLKFGRLIVIVNYDLYQNNGNQVQE